ncbi:MAG: hypothetical protein L0322_29300, partial [Chloroflexi bacterium]|nr:hypothetical protein [Chloroflexota bacterium]MCI0578567.1 hypothetical protein [Chloroflexota bacterium]
ASTITGSLLGALLIGATEDRIVAGHREPPAVVLTNAAVMSLLTLGLGLYLLANWSNWRSDLLGGALIAVLLSAAQSAAARERIGLGHTAAFALAFPLGLMITRLLVELLPGWAAVLSITAIVTVVISLVDYGPRYAGRSESGDHKFS